MWRVCERGLDVVHRAGELSTFPAETRSALAVDQVKKYGARAKEKDAVTSSSSALDCLNLSSASPAFFSHSSRSCSMRAIVRSKCSALTSTCRSLLPLQRRARVSVPEC